jgi:hypothetical protein
MKRKPSHPRLVFCAECDQSFIRERRGTRFCSSLCRGRASRRRRAAGGVPEVVEDAGEASGEGEFYDPGPGLRRMLHHPEPEERSNQ